MSDEAPDLLITAAEIQKVTNRAFTGDTAEAIAVMATSAVRDFCGWRVAKRRTETVTVRTRGRGIILLPSLHVHAITSVSVNGELLTASQFDWDESGVLERVGGRWPTARRAVQVTIDHGYETCPGGIAQSIAAAVARGVFVPAGGIASEAAMGQSYVYSRMSAGGLAAGQMFVTDELDRINPHRIGMSR